MVKLAAASRLTWPLVATAALLLIFLMIHPAHAARDTGTAEDIQACSSTEQCTLVEAGCETSCDLLPINRAYAEELRKGRNEICGETVRAQPSCLGQDQYAACVQDRCTISRARPSRASWSDYKAPGDNGWTWASETENWDMNGFTAYDMPQELVKQGRLELRNR